MNVTKFKPSLSLESIFDTSLSADSENFLLFLKAYYEWLQTTKIIVTNVVGTFQRDEIIIGGVSKATGIIKEVGNGYLIVNVTSRYSFSFNELLTGQTSDSTANCSEVKDNVIRATEKVLDYRVLDTSIDQYINYIKEELYSSIPKSVLADKTLLAEKLRSFFQTRSNEESYRFLFKLLYNEEIEFYYPGEDVLRPSDGKFEKTQVIRAVVVPNIFEYQNKTIRGRTSGSLATVVDIKTFFVSSLETAELTLKLVSGSFIAGEIIENIDDVSSNTIIYGMVTGFNINDGGSGYEVGNIVAISGDGSEAQARVSSIQDSPITALNVNEIGYGYRVGTTAVVNNTGTGGSGLIIRVTEINEPYTVTDGSNNYTVGEISKLSILNRGENYIKVPTITVQDTTIESLGLLTEKLITIDDAGIDYAVGNTLVFTGGSGSNAAGQVASVVESVTYDLLFEDDTRIIIDGSYEDILKDEDWNVIGPIRRIELTNFGTGYTTNDLPTITVNTTTGSGANLIATNIQGKSANVTVDTSNNIAGIGAIRAIEITNFGLNYTNAVFDLSASGDGNANVDAIVSGLGIKSGNWINDDGKLDYKFLQDSFFYQDFSYVIRSGLAFSVYADTIKQVIHPAGLIPFGEILISSFIDFSYVDIISQDITKYIIYITSLLNVGIVDITTTINVDYDVNIESKFDVTSDLEDKEYVIKIESEKSVEFDIVANNSILQFEINPFVDLTPQTLQVPATKYLISTTDTALAYGVRYADLTIQGSSFYPEDWSNVQISTLQNVRFSDIYKSEPAATSIINKYLKVNGTVSSSTASNNYSELQILELSNVQIGSLQNLQLSSNVSTIVGTATTFTTDFVTSDILLANNELFTVVLVFNDNLMSVNREPTLPFTNVFAYKQII